VSEQNRLLRSQRVSPEDDFAYGQGISPEATWRNLIPFAEFGLGMAPVSGEAMAARDAWDASGRGGNALLRGDYGQAASDYLNMGTGLLGAIPGAGIVARGTKRGAAWMDRNLPEGFNRLLDSVYPQGYAPKDTTHSIPAWRDRVNPALAPLERKITEAPITTHGDYAIHRRMAGPNGPLEYVVARKGGSYDPSEAGYYMAEYSHPDVFASARVRMDGPNMAPVNVREDMKRQGIGTLLYDTVDEDLASVGERLRPDQEMTPEVRAFWDKRNMTASERRATPPWETQDVPDDQQIVRFGNQGPAYSASSGDIYGTISKNNQVGDYRLVGPSSDDTYEIIRSDGKRVGDINIGQMDDGSVYLGPRIDPEFQKQGIASEIYKHVQGLADQSGLKLKKSNLQTPAGDALWRSLERR
jgi:GNAT superfamily N-acetyltransferase